MRRLDSVASPDGRQAPTLAILLPGALQQPEDFQQAGFVDAVRQRGLALDLALVDPGISHIGETTSGEAVRRLHDSIVRPAREAGYRHIWLAGISIGGFMAMAHAAHYPGQAQGLCLLSPYPGNRMLTRDIAVAGGLAAWQGGADGDDEQAVWAWLRQWQASPPAQPRIPRLHLAYGREDRFAGGLALMATALDARDVHTVPGGHDWPTWRMLWDNFLDHPPAELTGNPPWNTPA